MFTLFSLIHLASLVFPYGVTTNDVWIVLIVCSTLVAIMALYVWMLTKLPF